MSSSMKVRYWELVLPCCKSKAGKAVPDCRNLLVVRQLLRLLACPGWGQYDTERVTRLAMEQDPSRIYNGTHPAAQDSLARCGLAR